MKDTCQFIQLRTVLMDCYIMNGKRKQQIAHCNICHKAIAHCNICHKAKITDLNKNWINCLYLIYNYKATFCGAACVQFYPEK